MYILDSPAHYRLFGLSMASSLAFPSLHTISDLPDRPDVPISMGTVPTTLADPVIRKVFYQLRKFLRYPEVSST